MENVKTWIKENKDYSYGDGGKREGHDYGCGYGNGYGSYSGDGYGYGSGGGDGYGDGNGYGDGCGSGCGYSHGDGYGNGSGSGLGDGWGSGDGSGLGLDDGSGSSLGDGWGSGWDDGSGYGYGSGSGSGSGDGSGYGCVDGCGFCLSDGIDYFNGEKVFIIDGLQTIINHIKGNVAKGGILNGDFTITPCFVVKGNGYFTHGETVREAFNALRSKIFENMDPEEAIESFMEKFEKNKKYPCKDFYEWHHYLTDSCEMGRKSFMQNKGITFDDSFTVDEFIEICENDYGSEIIKQLKERWGIITNDKD